MHLINNHSNGKTKCEWLQMVVYHNERVFWYRLQQRTFLSLKSIKYYYLECSHVALHSRNELIFIIDIKYTEIIAIHMRLGITSLIKRFANGYKSKMVVYHNERIFRARLPQRTLTLV